MNSKKNISFVLLQIFWIGMLASTLSAQKKFEFGIRMDALTIPVNFGTFIEDGPGYYDIHAKGNITQAAYLDFTYWPLKHWGISLGAGVHRFYSEIEYLISDPSNSVIGDTTFYRHDELKGRGGGPVLAFHYRNDKFRASMGMGAFQFSTKNFPMRSMSTYITVFEPPDVLAHLQIDEVSYWQIYGLEYDLYQFNVAYEVLNHLFLNIGFESTLSIEKFYLYTTKITGFTYNTSPEDQPLNDFKMSHAFSAFSVGVKYEIGFGKYKEGEIEE
jgi:hypothetical protein